MSYLKALPTLIFPDFFYLLITMEAFPTLKPTPLPYLRQHHHHHQYHQQGAAQQLRLHVLKGLGGSGTSGRGGTPPAPGRGTAVSPPQRLRLNRSRVGRQGDVVSGKWRWLLQHGRGTAVAPPQGLCLRKGRAGKRGKLLSAEGCRRHSCNSWSPVQERGYQVWELWALKGHRRYGYHNGSLYCGRVASAPLPL